MNYAFSLAILILIYSVSATAENFIVGYSGQFSAAQGAILGIGAYTYAFAGDAGWPLAASLLVVVAIGAAVGGSVSFLGNRVRGDNFMVVTLAFQMVLIDVANNLTVTGGAEGKGGLRPVNFGSFVPHDPGAWLIVVAVFAVVAAVIYGLVSASRIALVWKSIREDESATASLGRSPTIYKVLAFAFGSAGTAFAGAMYGSYISYVSPGEFTISYSVFIISVLIVGGIGNPIGPFVGVFVLTLIPELLRFVPDLPLDFRARLLQLFYSGLLLLFLALRPQGLVPEGALRGLLRGIRNRRLANGMVASTEES